MTVVIVVVVVVCSSVRTTTLKDQGIWPFQGLQVGDIRHTVVRISKYFYGLPMHPYDTGFCPGIL